MNLPWLINQMQFDAYRPLFQRQDPDPFQVLYQNDLGLGHSIQFYTNFHPGLGGVLFEIFSNDD